MASQTKFWVAVPGAQHPSGPFTLDDLANQVRGGSMPLDAQVCEVGESRWAPLSESLPKTEDSYEVTTDQVNIVGPVSKDQLLRGTKAGKIPGDAMVRLVGTAEWLSLAQVLAPPGPTPPKQPPRPTATAQSDEEPEPSQIDLSFFGQHPVACPSCDKKQLRPRTRTKDFRCQACSTVFPPERIFAAVEADIRSNYHRAYNPHRIVGVFRLLAPPWAEKWPPLEVGNRAYIELFEAVLHVLLDELGTASPPLEAGIEVLDAMLRDVPVRDGYAFKTEPLPREIREAVLEVQRRYRDAKQAAEDRWEAEFARKRAAEKAEMGPEGVVGCLWGIVFLLLVGGAYFLWARLKPPTTSSDELKSLSAEEAGKFGMKFWDADPPDHARAVAHFKRACDGGDTLGCSGLGYAYVSGLGGVPKDFGKAFPLLDPACSKGVLRACSSVAKFYYFDWLGKGDRQRGRDMWQKSCEGGESRGCYWMGMALSASDAPREWQDLKKARSYFKKSCDLGYRDGCEGGAKLDKLPPSPPAPVFPGAASASAKAGEERPPKGPKTYEWRCPSGSTLDHVNAGCICRKDDLSEWTDPLPAPGKGCVQDYSTGKCMWLCK